MMTEINKETGELVTESNSGWFINLYKPLIIPPEVFLKCLHHPHLENEVLRHSFKEQSQKGKEIKYLSWSSVLSVFRQEFPHLQVSYVQDRNGYPVFKEIDGGGYYCLPFIHNGVERSEPIHFSILTSSGAAVLPGKLTSKEINTALYRALVKVIAFVTGLGLRCWIGSDLDEEVLELILKNEKAQAQKVKQELETKQKAISAINNGAKRYQEKYSTEYDLPILSTDMSIEELRGIYDKLKTDLVDNTKQIESSSLNTVNIEAVEVKEGVENNV